MIPVAAWKEESLSFRGSHKRALQLRTTSKFLNSLKYLRRR